MPVDFVLGGIGSLGTIVPSATLHAFLLVLVRIGGAITFVPIPGLKAAPALPKIFLAVALSLILTPAWMAKPPTEGISFVQCLFAEAAFGIAAGVVVAWLNEAFVIGMQVLSMPAGYGYASMIDPTTQADSGILAVVAQLTAMLLFVALGLDREVLRAFGTSLATVPPGSFRVDEATVQVVVRHTSAMLSLGARLALPLVALLVLVDLALALLGRINAHLQLLSLAFPVKMLLSLFVLSSLIGLWPLVYRQAAEGVVSTLWRLAAAHP